MNQAVTLTVADGVGHIQLNRPEAANTLDMPLASGLRAAATAVAEDDAVRAVLFTGAGARFCGGGDIAAIAGADDAGEYLHALAMEVDAAVQALESLAKPVVSAVHGAVAGGGLGLMLCGDAIVAQDGTKFVFAYPAIGLSPDCGTSRSLPRAMGQQRALAFALSGRPLSAEAALTQGLVTEVAANAQDRGLELATTLAKGASAALGDARRLLRAGWSGTREEVSAEEAATISSRVTTPEAQELLAAFLKR